MEETFSLDDSLMEQLSEPVDLDENLGYGTKSKTASELENTNLNEIILNY